MTVEKVRGALRIAHTDVRAAKIGLKRGIALADARACFPSLTAVPSDPEADRAFLHRLAGLSDRFSPMVALEPPDGLVLDITGCAHLFGGEAHLRKALMTRFEAQGVHTRASIAATPDAARALARFSSVAVAAPGEEEALTRPLPVAAITGVSSETRIALSRAGLKTIGAVAERPLAALAARFGEEFATCLLRTLGRENVRITPLRPLPPIVTERQFAEPMTQTQAIEGILLVLIEEAAHLLTERGEGGRVFEARFFRSDGAVRDLRIETGQPSREPGSILRLYHERLQSLADPIDPGFGFDAIRLGVLITEPLAAVQPEFGARARNDDDTAGLIDTLTVRFGRERVLRFAARDTHDPARASGLIPAANAGRGTSDWPKPEAGEPPLRPVHLFQPPQLIEAMAEVPDGPPRRFRWRRVLHDVAHAEGPERIAPEWWLAAPGTHTRDYYRVEDGKGGRFWIFREGLYGGGTNPRWFLHGVFA